ncbi:MAG: hypothetical protein ACOYNG_07915 [Terrimicrobiaceae bacterium]
MGKISKRLVRTKTFAVAAGLAAGFLLSSWISHSDSSARQKLLQSFDPLEVKSPPRAQSRRLEEALVQLRDGKPAEAFQALSQLERENSTIPSLTYFAALAALQSGDNQSAISKADASIAKRERIADSLALKAVVESQKPRSGAFADPAALAQGFLEQAAMIEPGNPAPLLELASILRYRAKNDEALELLRAARNRLNPVDSHAVVDTTIRLLELQALDDTSLPAPGDPGNSTAGLFASAYLAMRTADFAAAASTLDTAKKNLPPDLFLYLVNDPALRRYADQPALAGFFY